MVVIIMASVCSVHMCFCLVATLIYRVSIIPKGFAQWCFTITGFRVQCAIPEVDMPKLSPFQR